jgi:DMSO reductase anchor subunit
VGRIVADEKAAFDWGVVFTALACLFLGGSLVLFIRNNQLLAHGGRNFLHPVALIMFAVLGVPFILVLLHLVRSVRGQRQPRT